MLFRRSVVVKFVIWNIILAACLMPPLTDAAPPSPGKITSIRETPDGFVRVRAKAALVLNLQSGEVIYKKNPMAKLPIASLTKLMTTVTFMNMNPDLNKRITISRQDVYQANWTLLKYREKVYVRDLLHAALIASDNAAARALARATGLSRKEFVERMNQTAVSLGLLNSSFTDPTGLYAGNVSTVVDCAALLWTALQNDVIAEILSTKAYQFRTSRRSYNIRTTNLLLRNDNPEVWEIMGGKTGYIRKAGYCLVTRARDQIGNDVVAVVLGGVSSRTRFADMRRLLHWGFQNIEQQVRVGG